MTQEEQIWNEAIKLVDNRAQLPDDQVKQSPEKTEATDFKEALRKVRPIYEKGPHKELSDLQQQSVFNDNIIEQLQIRIQQDEKKTEKLLRVFEDMDQCFSQSSPDLIYIKARIKDVLKEYYKLYT